MKTFNRLQQVLVSFNLIGLLIIGYLLLTYEQDWGKLSQSAAPAISQKKEPEAAKEAEAEPPTPPADKLMDHRNHNNAAASYAYDVKTIRQHLTGELPYEGGNLVFLTIDDGANRTITPAILDILASHQVHATFFPIGSYVTEERADLYRRQIREGHAIGLHSYTHDLSLLYPNRIADTNQIIREAQEASKAFKRILGLKFQTRVWRYPGGAMSWQGLEESHQRLATELGLEWIDWNASFGDAEPHPRQPLTLDEMIAFHTASSLAFSQSPSNLKVVLLHDAADKHLTLEALPHIIQYYKDNGYTFGVLY